MAKIDKWLKKKGLEEITLLARDKNNTIATIARHIGISASTFYNWLNKYPEIEEAFENGRKGVDEEVENAFFKMCTGYHEKVIKVHKVKRTKFDERGKRIEEFEELVPVEEEQYIPPSVAAQKFYLCNRMNDKYRPERAELPSADDDNNSGVVELPIVEAELIE